MPPSSIRKSLRCRNKTIPSCFKVRFSPITKPTNPKVNQVSPFHEIKQKEYWNVPSLQDKVSDAYKKAEREGTDFYGLINLPSDKTKYFPTSELARCDIFISYERQ